MQGKARILCSAHHRLFVREMLRGGVGQLLQEHRRLCRLRVPGYRRLDHSDRFEQLLVLVVDPSKANAYFSHQVNSAMRLLLSRTDRSSVHQIESPIPLFSFTARHSA